MQIKNYYIHHGNNTIQQDENLFTLLNIISIIEHIYHHEESKTPYTNDIFRIKDTDIIFAVDDFAGITEDADEVSIHMGKVEETESVGRTLRVNKSTHSFELTDIYSVEL